MKHLKKFEEKDYLSHLKGVSDLKHEFENSEKEEKKNRSKEDFAKKLKDESDKRNKSGILLEERNEIMYKVSHALMYSDLSKNGFDGFKNDLLELLSKYPVENLPRSGYSIYNKK